MKSIWRKLALKIALTLMIVLPGVGVADIYLQYLKETAELHAKETRTLQQLTFILGAPLYHLDLQQIENIFSIYLSEPDILSIKVVENDHILKYLGKASTETQELIDLAQQQIEYSSSVDLKSEQVIYEEKVLGTVTILFSRETIRSVMQRSFFFVAGTLLLAVLMVSGMVFFLIRKHVSTHLWRLVQAAESIAAGNVNIALKKDSSDDEIGHLQRAMQDMVVYIKNVAEVAEQVANQQLHTPITPKSTHDLLNHSLRKMVKNLQEMIDQNTRTVKEIEQQNWLNDGLNQLNAELMGHISLEDTCHRAVSFVARYVNAGRGVLYVYDVDQHVLTLSGTFAFTETDDLAHIVRLGQGIIGQVALERAPIVLTHLQGKNYRVNTGIVSERPATSYTAPLVYNNELYGVIELASFETFDDRQQHFLNEANQVLATVIFSALQRERVQELLRTSEQAILEAEAAEQIAQQQREEAQKANALLEEQQQRLHQQSEEMRQINAHLEEQQQQLQQQREELRQQNEALQRSNEDMKRRVQQGETREYDRGNIGGQEERQASPPIPEEPAGSNIESAENTMETSSGSNAADEESSRTSLQPLPFPSPEHNSLAGRKIVIVDDDMKNVFVLAAALENQGATVIDAQNGKIALDILRQDEEIDLVLVDVMMPVMNGYATMREIRNDAHLAHLPIIALTAKTSQQERQKCLETGANEYLSTPVDDENLLHVIHTWLKHE